MFDSEKFWDNTAKRSSKELIKEEQSFAKLVARTKKHLKSSDIVMDYGCGTGVLANGIAGDVKEVHAIDISTGMIEVGKGRSKELKHTNIHFKQATIFDASFKKETFDAIVAYNILHLVDTKPVVKRIAELLKPGGVFISTTACLAEKTPWWFIIFLFSRLGLVPKVRKFKTSELDGIISSCNFTISETKTLQRSTFNHYILAEKHN